MNEIVWFVAGLAYTIVGICHAIAYGYQDTELGGHLIVYLLVWPVYAVVWPTVLLWRRWRQ